MFSVEGGADNDGDFETSGANDSAADYSYTQSTESRKGAGRRRKKSRLSVEDREDNANDSKTTRPGK